MFGPERESPLGAHLWHSLGGHSPPYQEFIADSLVERHLPEWRTAFNHSGKGSTFDGARDIRGIYEPLAPVPGAVVTRYRSSFSRTYVALYIGPWRIMAAS